MDKGVDFLFAASDSKREQFNFFLSKYIFTAVGTIVGMELDTNLARVRTYANNPLRPFEEYEGVEILLPSGVSIPLEGCLCILMAPRTPMLTAEGLTLLVDEGAYSNKALKAIPVTPFAAVQEYGAGVRNEGFSLYTPFGDISVSPEGMGIHFVSEEAKASIKIDSEGLITVSNNDTWVNLDGEGNLSTHSENNDVITETSINAGVTQLKQVTNDDDQNTLLDINTDAEGNIHIEATVDSEAETQNTIDINANGISIIDVNENSIDMTSSGISIEDANGNTVETTSEHIYVEGPNGTLEIT